MELTNSKRLLYCASHVTSKLTDDEQRQFGGQIAGALKKVNLLRALNVGQDVLGSIRARIGRATPELTRDVERLIAASSRLAQEPTAHLAVAQSLASVSDTSVVEFARIASGASPASGKLGLLGDLYQLQMKVFPIGQLYLERLEMFPAGVERGELVFTVPMAPGESTTISHKEWSVSTRGYEETAQDFFENYSEHGVTEKTDTATSAETEVRRSNALNFGATLSGSYGPVSVTTNLGLNSSKEDRQAAKSSMQRSREVTDKASARVRQEHKVSMKIETKQGMDETSYKTMTNDSSEAVRIDYYKMMRKWRTDLFRYGLRMTYDITIPTPGVRLWARWQRLAAIDAAMAAPFTFKWKPEDINEGWVFAEGVKRGLLIEPPPPFVITPPPIFDETPYFKEDFAGEVRFGRIDFDVPAGYQLASATFTADLAVWVDLENFLFTLNANDLSRVGDHVTSGLPQHIGSSGHQTVSYTYRGVSQAALSVAFTCVRQPSTFEAWQKGVWRQLLASEQALHQAENARLQEERDRLWRALVGKDTLSLRRLEREEMVRLIMLWLVGPNTGYANAPTAVESTLDQMLKSEVAFLNGGAPALPSPTFATVDGTEWAGAMIFGDLVKFVQQAVEWENLLYFLYPYFWGGEAQGRDRMLFEHPDPEHQNFLRAGYCRVVITIRPGFEADFTRLVETGSLGGTYSSPYLTIAEEIANRARTNYAGIPPANPEKHARPLLFPEQRQTWATMEQVIAAIEQFKADHGEYPPTLSDLPAGVATSDAWGNELVYALPGSGNDYDLISLGSDGKPGGDGTAADISAAAGASLMASWFDYTPTSGIDIVVNSAPDAIA